MKDDDTSQFPPRSAWPYYTVGSVAYELAIGAMSDEQLGELIMGRGILTELLRSRGTNLSWIKETAHRVFADRHPELNPFQPKGN